jgi:hypothetical protein
MKIKKSYVIELPEWALPYLINGDDSGLSVVDKTIVESWIVREGLTNENYIISTDESEYYFSHLPAFGLPCMCSDARIVIFEKE